MKANTTTLILGVSLAVVAGLFGSTIFGVSDSNNSAQTSASASGLITGHVTTTLRDADGNIKEYRQSDNTIVNNGENCVAKMLFGSSPTVAGTSVCTGSITDGFRYVGIGNYTTAVNGTNTTLGNEYSSAKGVASLARGGAATVTMTNSTGATGSSASVLISKQFTSSQAAAQIVQESALFNSTSVASGGMFARQTFSSITMNNGDSLTVAWTVNIGGTTGSLSNP